MMYLLLSNPLVELQVRVEDHFQSPGVDPQCKIFQCIEVAKLLVILVQNSQKVSILKQIALLYQGAGKRPRQCCHPKGGNGAEGLKGPRTKGTATRGPESGQNMRVRGPEGPEDEQS